MEKNDKEKLLIDDIRSLFEQLKEEEKGRYQPGTGFMKSYFLAIIYMPKLQRN